MKRRFFRCVLAAFFTIAIAAQAQEQEHALPEEVVAHFSFANPEQFLKDVFAYVDAATTDTGFYAPADVMGMVAMAYSPVPFDAWDMADEVNVLFLGDAYSPKAAVLFRINSFGELLSGLEGADWSIDSPDEADSEGDGVFADLRSVVLPNGREMILADLGEGRAVLAEDGETARLAVALNPEHGSYADFVARTRMDGPLGESLADFSEVLFDEITGGADDIVDAVVEIGLTEKAGRLLADLAAKYGRAAGEEIEQAEEVALELSFVAGRLDLAFAARFADGSWMRKFADTVEEKGGSARPDGALLKRLPEGYFTSGVSASLADLMPDAKAMFAGVLSDIAELSPESRGELLASNSAFFAAGPGAMASANYLNGGAPYQVLLCEYEDPRFALDAMAGTGGVLNDIAAASFAEPAESISLSRETQSDGEREWYAWRIAAADGEEEGFAGFLSRLDGIAPEEAGVMGMGTVLDPAFRIYAACLEDPAALLIVTGALNQDEFAAILGEIDSAGEDAATPLDDPEVLAAVEGMDAAQLSIGFLKPADLFQLFLMQYAAQTGEEIPPFVFEGERFGGADAVIGAGAEDGRVVARLALPSSAVNAVIRMQEAISAAETDAALAELREEAEAEAENEIESESEDEPETEE